ncbi:MAG TPA: ABC transporter substrate-binding protein [Ramlibacter sp.]|nr:ABC transporter substrate-binding protein [Ramlibacter sp.]
MQAKFGHILALGAITLALTGAATAQAQSAQPPIKLGVLLATSGVGASTGLGILEGVKLAVEEINAAGGIKGRKVEFLLRDTQIKPDVAVAVAKELLAKEGVKIFIGPATSGESLAVSELAKNEKVVNIAPTAKAESLTGPNLHDYIFQLPATTDVDGVRLVRLMKEIGTRSVCFVGFDYAYTTDLFKSIKANIGDIKDAGNYLVPVTATDYNTMVSQLAANSCDTIMGTMFGGGFIAFMKQAAPFGITKSKKIIWGASLGEYSVAQTLKGDMPEGMWASGGDAWYINLNDTHKKFHDSLAKMLGRPDSSMWALTGYNAVNFAKAAIEKAGTDQPQAVAKALKGLTIQSPLGELTIDAKTHRVAAPEIYGQIKAVPGSDVKRLTNPRLVR